MKKHLTKGGSANKNNDRTNVLKIKRKYRKWKSPRKLVPNLGELVGRPNRKFGCDPKAGGGDPDPESKRSARKDQMGEKGTGDQKGQKIR